ncbi:MAG: N-acetylneuraminate synthase, partial [Proteobacteria bacterium]
MDLQLFSDPKAKPFVIAEIAQTHDGSLGLAHAFIDEVAYCGAHAVKFQTHIAEAESTHQDQWRVKFSRQDKTRLEYWRRMQFTEEQWKGLSDHAQDRGLVFISSPFSVEAVELLDRLKMPIWKVASGEMFNEEVLEAIWKTRRPILFSTGLCTEQELNAVVIRTKSLEIPCGIFQCTSEYPVPPENWGLNAITKLSEDFGLPVGLSDHSGVIYPSLAAVALGAKFLEVHVTFHKKMFGPDVPSSLDFTELKNLVS